MVTLKAGDRVIENVSLVIFDKDGTLIDLYQYWASMVSLRAEELCRIFKLDSDFHQKPLMYAMGVDSAKKVIRPRGPVGILPREVVQKAAEDYLSEIKVRGDIETACFDTFKKIDNVSLQHLDTFIKWIPGARTLLEELRQKSCMTAIATTDKTHRANIAVEHLNIATLLDFVVGADMVQNSKPAPDMVHLIEQKLDIKAQSSVVVGDAITDVKMGKAAGCRASIAVLTGMTPERELAEETDYVVNSIADISILE